MKIVLTEAPKRPRRKIESPTEAAALFAPIRDDDTEVLGVAYLTLNQRVLATEIIGIGGQAGVPIDPRTIFRTALLRKADMIILAHNHPAGNINPSESDIEWAKRILYVGKILGIELLDFLILVPRRKRPFSFMKKGLLDF